MPELSLQDLQKVQVEDYSWIHLEGRNRENLLLMLEYLAKQDSVKVSVEVEKVGKNFEDFIPLADVVFALYSCSSMRLVGKNFSVMNSDKSNTYFIGLGT